MRPPLLPAERGSGAHCAHPAFCNPASLFCVQKAAEYQVGGGNELNRVTYISQVGWQPCLGGWAMMECTPIEAAEQHAT